MTCRGISATGMERVLRKVLGEIAVPKPSRAAELYAALTLSIVLLQEQVATDATPVARKHAVGHEIAELRKKRAELEEELEAGLGG